MDIKACVRTVPDWPKKGIMFRDLTTCMKDPDVFRETCDIFYERYKGARIEKVVGIDARGFVYGSVLAYKLGVGFVPVRKHGKLPAETIGVSYSLEYGESIVEIHKDAIEKGERVVIIDDLMATGGTAAAAAALVEKLSGEIVELAFVVELPDLKGREKIKGHKVFSITEFSGD